MAVTSTPIFPQVIQSPSVQILPADTTTLKTVYTPGANGSKVESVMVTTTDTAGSNTLVLYITTGGTDYKIASIILAGLAGNNGTTATLFPFSSTLFILPKDSNGNSYLYLGSGSVLRASVLNTVTVAKVVNISATGGDY